MSGPSSNGSDRSVKIDVYAPVDIAREHDLTDRELWALITLTLRADYRSGKWTGTVEDLAEQTRSSWRAARKALDRLEACGLIEFVRLFRQNQQGIVLVAVYPRLRRPASRVDHAVDLRFLQNRGNGDEAIPAPFPRNSRANPAEARESEPLTSADAAARGREEGEEKKLAARGTGEESPSRAPTVEQQAFDRPTVGGLRRSGAAKDPRRFMR